MILPLYIGIDEIRYTGNYNDIQVGYLLPLSESHFLR